MAEGEGRAIPISDIISEDGAHELATSENMQPYIRLAMAVLQDADPTRRLEEVAALPLEKRYIWRVASALKWGFADFDDVNVETDTATLGPKDLEKVWDLLKFRPIQFCLFLKALVTDYEADGILTDGDDPLNQLRRRDDFLDGVRGLKHGEVIRAAVRARKNILVVGSTGSGKTTLVNAILDSLARLTPHDRVISIEDTTELQCPVKNYLDLRAVGNVTMLECLRPLCSSSD